MRRIWTCLFTFGIALASCGFVQAEDKLQYNRDIRPILAENCFACHGPDSAARKAGLRLDKRETAIEAGAIAPGKPNESDLVRRINATDKDHMPPVATRKVLTAQQKETLAKWIASGAEYQPHWSFIAPKRPVVPQIRNSQSKIRNPIDAFILARLEMEGLKPAPEADRRTLARRLSLDLTGLPPEPAVVDAFVNDTSPDWYEKYVDQLMKSPAWGEHRGRYWLDAARYADSHGIHFDNYREIWAYRDWVINAFNRNMPFDQFTIEQLAGDLLPNRTLDQHVATGFNRCNITTNEGGAINEEYLVLYARDRTETFSQVWLGLTTGCAVCHDHKFDPITARDFYSLSAFFNNSVQNAMDGNIKDTPPVIFVPRAEDRPRLEAIARDIAAVRQQLEARKSAAKADFDQWVKSAKPETLEAPIPTDGLTFLASLSEGKGRSVPVSVNGKERPVNFNRDAEWDMGKFAPKALKVRPGDQFVLRDAGDLDHQGFSYGCWVKLPANGTTGAIFSRMDEGNSFRGWDLWVQNNMVGAHIISKWQEDAVKAVAKQPLKPGEWYHVFVTYDGSGKAAGLKVYINGSAQPTNVEADSLKGPIKTKAPFKLAQRNTTSRIDNLALQDVRIYNRVLTPRDVAALAKSNKASAILKKPADKRTEAEKNELYEWWLGSFDKPYQQFGKRLNELTKDESALKAKGTTAYVWQEKPGEPSAYILYRGEYDKRRDPVKPDTPKALPPIKKSGPVPTRIELAKWLLQPENPLTARVTVNRFWQELFGTGLVRTSGDFGVAGELPSHPELLDWLAVEFREGGWDVRKFFKLLVTSATYRQAAIVTPEKVAKDRDNRLLSRGPRFRMDAEMIRDYALEVSGLLSRKIGGPSVKPYQPPGVWEAVAMIGSNTRDYRADSGDGLYRRSMYTFWKRAAPPASMDIFNAPNRETCAVRRERTNTPLQALVTLNDPQFVEAARHMAARAIKGDHAANCVIQGMAKRLLGRNFDGEEEAVVQRSLEGLLAYYKAHPEDAKKLIAVGESKPDPSLDPVKLAAWTMLANELMNLDEVLNK